MPSAELDEIFLNGVEEFDLQHKKMMQFLNLIYNYYQRRLEVVSHQLCKDLRGQEGYGSFAKKSRPKITKKEGKLP